MLITVRYEDMLMPLAGDARGDVTDAVKDAMFIMRDARCDRLMTLRMRDERLGHVMRGKSDVMIR